jgi:hypothetical protein
LVLGSDYLEADPVGFISRRPDIEMEAHDFGRKGSPAGWRGQLNISFCRKQRFRQMNEPYNNGETVLGPARKLAGLVCSFTQPLLEILPGPALGDHNE